LPLPQLPDLPKKGELLTSLAGDLHLGCHGLVVPLLVDQLGKARELILVELRVIHRRAGDSERRRQLVKLGHRQGDAEEGLAEVRRGVRPRVCALAATHLRWEVRQRVSYPDAAVLVEDEHPLRVRHWRLAFLVRRWLIVPD